LDKIPINNYTHKHYSYLLSLPLIMTFLSNLFKPNRPHAEKRSLRLPPKRSLRLPPKRSLRVPQRYLPKSLSLKDRKKQARSLRRSRGDYKRGLYTRRAPVASFKSKPSGHVAAAKQTYNVDSLTPGPQLARATGCSVGALRAIVKKGEGAFYSSGSRPNQTPQSWGLARLGSAITGSKAAAVDYDILERGCNSGSKALRLARTARRKFGHGRGATRKTIL